MIDQNQVVRVVGIDPGTRVVGFALIESLSLTPRSPRDWRVVDAGVLRANAKLPVHERLTMIHETLFELVGDWSPQYAAIEKAFFGVNAATGIKMGEARGSIMTVFGRHRLNILEFTPAEIKRLVGGSGASTKKDVEHALRALLGYNPRGLPLDASDALAIALSGAVQVMVQLALKSRSKASIKPASLRAESGSN